MIAADAAWALGITEPPKASEFRDAANRCTDSMVAVLARIQKWEIAFAGGHSKFAKGLSQSLEHVRDAATKLFPLMAAGNSEGHTLRDAGRGVQLAALGLTGLLWDLRVESQNLLLGGLFQYRVPRRQPTDASVSVMTLN